MSLAILSLACLLTAPIDQDPPVVPLWEGGAPGFEDRKGEPEEAKDYWVRNIHNPEFFDTLRELSAPAAATACSSSAPRGTTRPGSSMTRAWPPSS